MIGIVKNSDRIRIDAKKNTIDLLIDEAEIANRRSEWTQPAYKANNGVLRKYILL